jgi:hypothetical protein
MPRKAYLARLTEGGTSLPSTMAPVTIGQAHLPLLQLPQLQLDGDVLRDAEVHGAGAGGIGELNGAVNQAHGVRLKAFCL